jgi:hypothetical protein
MPANDHLQHEQLAMFMTPSEVKGYATPGDFAHDYQEQGWDRKLAESKMPMGARDEWGGPQHGAGVYDSVAKSGVKTPVEVYHTLGTPYTDPAKVLVNGHHRVAAAHDIEESGKETYIPVTHEDITSRTVYQSSSQGSRGSSYSGYEDSDMMSSGYRRQQ